MIVIGTAIQWIVTDGGTDAAMATVEQLDGSRHPDLRGEEQKIRNFRWLSGKRRGVRPGWQSLDRPEADYSPPFSATIAGCRTLRSFNSAIRRIRLSRPFCRI